ncbi:unnamed protein product [Ascophyllum nodosum]
MNTKAAAIAAQRGEDEIISVEETVWSLRLGARNPPCNIAKFEEVWVNTGDGKRKVTSPPFDDPALFTKPAYMYRVQETEEHSEDEDYEGPGKMDAFDRPAFKRRVIKNRAIQWALEDRKDFVKGGGMKYLGDKTVQSSKYAIFKVDDQRSKTIEVTPIEQWWHFKKARKGEGKAMTVKEAEELMKKQENFMGPLSLANRVLGKKSLEAAERESAGMTRYGNLDHEDTQVLREAGVKLGGADDILERPKAGDGDSDLDEFELERDDVESDAGGEDDDFGDEIRSDDEEEVPKDDANEEGGTLHQQDDEDLNDSDGYFTDDEHHDLQKLSRDVNAVGTEEDEYTVGGDAGRASPTLPANGNPAAPLDPEPGSTAASGGSGGESGGVAGAKRGSSAISGEGASGPGGSGAGNGEGNGVKRPKKMSKKAPQGVTQASVVATLKRYGGRLASKHVLREFVAVLKVDGKPNRPALALLRVLLKKVANKVDDAIDGTVWILKDHFS